MLFHHSFRKKILIVASGDLSKTYQLRDPAFHPLAAGKLEKLFVGALAACEIGKTLKMLVEKSRVEISFDIFVAALQIMLVWSVTVNALECDCSLREQLRLVSHLRIFTLCAGTRWCLPCHHEPCLKLRRRRYVKFGLKVCCP